VGLPALPGAAMAASLVLLPESPRWLVLRGRLDAALQVLQHVLAAAGGQQVGGGGKRMAVVAAVGAAGWGRNWCEGHTCELQESHTCLTHVHIACRHLGVSLVPGAAAGLSRCCCHPGSSRGRAAAAVEQCGAGQGGCAGQEGDAPLAA
jgi:hypothetical protein